MCGNTKRAQVPTASTDCSCVRRRVDLSPQVIEEHNVYKEIVKVAKCGGILDCTDGAYANIKYEAYVDNKQRADIAMDVQSDDGARALISCGNHVNRLCEHAVTGCIDTVAETSAMRNVTNFIGMLRTSGYYLRLISVV